MSTYNGRRGPNVSHYIRDLNAIQQEHSPEENFNMEEDLSIFTNTQFFDFDSGQNTDYQAQPVKLDVDTTPSGATTSEEMTPAQSVMGDLSHLDFTMSSDFYPDFTNAYPSTPLNTFADGAQNYPSLPAGQPPVYPSGPQQQPQFTQPAPPPAEKRKSESMSGAGGRQMNFEEASRVAAEEDKRRRNTAASARFRIKKKQREQALEKSAKEMSDKVSNLENKVQQLEMENKWLKNLLVDKNEGNDEILTLWKEFAAQKSTKGKKEESKKEPVKEEQQQR